MRTCVFLFLAISLFAACKEKKQNLEDEVIAIHDEVMPKMGAIHIAKKALRKALDETNDKSLKEDLSTMISDLEKADEGMMDWMSEWKVPEDEIEKKKYLSEEKIKITKVKDDMLSSLENAHNYLSKATN